MSAYGQHGEIVTLQQRLLTRPLQPAARVEGHQLHWNGLVLTLNSTAISNIDIELAAAPHPLAVQHGFMLFVGCAPALRPHAKPLLDALAPLPDAWLWCGPRGSALFCRRVFDVFIHINGPLLAGTLQAAQPAVDWTSFFAKQHQLATQLLALAQQYRASMHDTGQPDLPGLRQEFALPPQQHPHYALTLARLLDIALSQQQATQQIFMQLLKPPSNTK